MDRSSSDIEAWASAYIAFQEDPEKSREDHPLFWAAMQFMLPGSYASEEECWAAILAVLSQNPSDPVIGMLAAGPLEDLLDAAGPRFIDRIESEARRNPAFRNLLGGTWESSTPEIWLRIEAARGEPW